jgi:Family of unknown function (DUF6152)
LALARHLQPCKHKTSAWAQPDAARKRRVRSTGEEIMSTLLNRPLRAARAPVLLAFAALGVATAAGPVLAHHAFAAEYDGEKPIDLKGVVTKARWVNPHSWLYFDVKAADGSVTNWGVEMGAPNALAGKGLLKTDLETGAQIEVQGYRAKNGGPYGYAVMVILHDGRSFQTGGAQDVPQQGGSQK